MTISRIDEAILSAVGQRWTKVAMVIAKVADTADDLPLGAEGHQLISQHIEGLIRSGRLAVQGNVRNWRFSEIRRVETTDNKIQTEIPSKNG
jgi:hypothetical protein